MADSPAPVNSLRPEGRARSLEAGDVPDALRNRYLTESGRLGGGLAFYVDATILVPSFRDRGRELVATRSDPNTIRDLVAIAAYRGWSSVRVQGAPGFRREAWLAGRTAGLEVDGYKPTERDEQALARRLAARERSADAARTPAVERPAERASRAADLSRSAERMRIVEAVLRDRIASPTSRARILAAARTRLAELTGRQDRGDAPRERRREPATVERRR